MNNDEMKAAFAKFLEEQSAKSAPSKTNREAIGDSILEYVKNHAGSTFDEITNGIKISQGSFYYAIKPLKANNKIVAVGKYPKRYYLAGTVEVEDVKSLAEDYSERILKFVSDNMGKTYTIREMSDKLKIPYGSMHKPMQYLKKRKLLPENFNKGSQPLNPKAAAKPPVKLEKTPAKAIGQLIFDFMRETRSTDVLQFLTWLENK